MPSLNYKLLQSITSRALSQLRKRWGLTHHEAQDICQEGMIAAMEAHVTYDPAAGGYNGWIWRKAYWGMQDACMRERSYGFTGLGRDLPALVDLRPPQDNDFDDDGETIESEGDHADYTSSLAHEDVDSLDGEIHVDRLRLGLSARSWHVLSMFYGLEGQRPMTVRDMAKHYDVSITSAMRWVNEAREASKAILGIQT